MLLNIYLAICMILYFYLFFLSESNILPDPVMIAFSLSTIQQNFTFVIWNVHLLLKVTSDLIPTWSRSHKTVALSSFCNFPLSGYLWNAKNYFGKIFLDICGMQRIILEKYWFRPYVHWQMEIQCKAPKLFFSKTRDISSFLLHQKVFYSLCFNFF